MKKITKLDRKKTDQAYWDRVLASYGLGIAQPLTDNSDEDSGEQKTISVNKVTTVSNDDTAKLRKRLDGDEAFMTAHQIQKTRTIEREIPEWAMSDRKVQRVLFTAFPKMLTNPSQKASAGRWGRVIYLSYRMELSHKHVGREIGISSNAVSMILRRATAYASGKVRGLNGRPKQK